MRSNRSVPGSTSRCRSGSSVRWRSATPSLVATSPSTSSTWPSAGSWRRCCGSLRRSPSVRRSRSSAATPTARSPSTPPCDRRSCCATRATLLPIDPSTTGRVAVLGRLAGLRNLGDGGSSDVRSSSVVTALAGLRAVFGDDRVVHDDTDASIAAGADLAVVVVGYTKDDEGEYMGAADMAQLERRAVPADRPSRSRRRRPDGAVRTDGPRPSDVRRPAGRRIVDAASATERGRDGARRGSGVAATVRRGRGAHPPRRLPRATAWSWWWSAGRPS